MWLAYPLGIAVVLLATGVKLARESHRESADELHRAFVSLGVSRWESRITNRWSEDRFADGVAACYELALKPGEADAFVAAASAVHDDPIVTGPWPSKRWRAPASAGPLRYITLHGGLEGWHVGVTSDGGRAYVEWVGL